MDVMAVMRDLGLRIRCDRPRVCVFVRASWKDRGSETPLCQVPITRSDTFRSEAWIHEDNCRVLLVSLLENMETQNNPPSL